MSLAFFKRAPLFMQFVLAVAACSSTTGTSSSSYCKNRAACDGTNAGQCEEGVTKTISKLQGDCRTKYEASIACQAAFQCINKIWTPSSDTACVTKVVEGEQCAALATTQGDGGTADGGGTKKAAFLDTCDNDKIECASDLECKASSRNEDGGTVLVCTKTCKTAADCPAKPADALANEVVECLQHEGNSLCSIVQRYP